MHDGGEGRNASVNRRYVPFMSQWEDCVALWLEAIKLSCTAGGSNYCDPLHEPHAVEERTVCKPPIPLQMKSWLKLEGVNPRGRLEEKQKEDGYTRR